ncbi:OBAP family protein [Spelaeicoccus albus]|uniref:DUF1264 domain-containing protein n=1 Tax=Spelaeicoccus albus TaxID=1280376 RepID=A0A7Z0D4I1_9MICO|nr:OBAP family protein [Spelaeicoccus albus]NYI68742.1 hypothetical protein [Spelaeicoccus albus]
MNRKIGKRPSPVTAAGSPTGGWLSVLENGAKLLQNSSPLRGFDAYVVGFHCPKNEPDMQMEAHHYCRAVNDDLLQCVLFDGNTPEANLIGIEYIISGSLFAGLPADEQAYWHPHNFEVLSGQLAAPGLPEIVETSLMKLLMNSYGKTWHTWHTGRHDGEAGDQIPLGDPKLMWSFNRDGECDESLKKDRDRAMGIDTAANRDRRQRLVAGARPQRGVNAMKDQFDGTTAIPGVVDMSDDGHPPAGPRPTS